MNPPSIPPPPPPPPPLNIPPSRARLQLAARLAMNKRNAAAAANGSQEVGSPSSDDASGSGTFSNLPNVSANDRMRNPFADDEDEDEDRAGSGSGSDDGDVENVDGDGVGSSAWNRGSWWRGVVRSARGGGRKNESGSSGRGGSSKETTIERFGDGRDDSDDSDGRGDEDDEEEMEDEEFGDFAMPEVMEGGAPMPPSSGGLISGIDPAREKILLKPLPLHPTTGSKTSVSSPFGGLWPFSSQGFGSKEKKDENDEPSGGDSGVVDETLSEEPIELGDDGMIGEDGKRIDRAIEAKRRTSIEDPDDDEVVIGEEIISVGRVHVGSD
ncbi:hypothetical protein B0H63DRAFT_523370 [Podospora didyma]|uniref:Uncharacterized protein n=1 Tax=Podospora didyma TaxID=330526 RepID=A0AAE0NQZ2_9PEZI|nr:hypothetical protein B0H63DRAFT_523370 [Podospora didyma]